MLKTNNNDNNDNNNDFNNSNNNNNNKDKTLAVTFFQQACTTLNLGQLFSA